MYYVEKVILNDVAGKPIIFYDVYFQNVFMGIKHNVVKSFHNKSAAVKYCNICNKAVKGDI